MKNPQNNTFAKVLTTVYMHSVVFLQPYFTVCELQAKTTTFTPFQRGCSPCTHTVLEERGNIGIF